MVIRSACGRGFTIRGGVRGLIFLLALALVSGCSSDSVGAGAPGVVTGATAGCCTVADVMRFTAGLSITATPTFTAQIAAVFVTVHRMRMVIAARVASMTAEPGVTAARVAPMEEACLVEEMHALKSHAAAPALAAVASVAEETAEAEE